MPEAFRIEPHGPPLPSFAGLYGAGDTRCRSDPDAQERLSCYAAPSIGVIVSGRFEYRSPIGRAEARPGVVLLGNAREEFAYRYLDADGVRRSVVALDEGLLAEVAGDCRCRDAAFPVAAVGAGRAATPLYALVRRLAAGAAADEETIVRLAAACLRAGARDAAPAGAAEQRRVREVAAAIDAAPAEPMSLSQMARLGGLSRYHFIRAFRAALGETPRQYQIAARLRLAADRLVDTKAPITEIAFDVGFNDISHFNATFRRAFGTSPRAWRQAA